MSKSPVVANETLRSMRFLDGGGEAARMIRERDWSDHPLGPPQGWPDALRIALSLVLNSPESMILSWGPELFFFFNDTYFPLLGPRLSWAMGARFRDVWADGWEQAKPIIDDAMAGSSTRFTDLPWSLDTDRGAKNTWWTFSYSRVLDADGAIAGLFIFTNETTDRVLGDAALKESQSNLELAHAELRDLNASLKQQVAERTEDRNSLWELSSDIMLRCGFDGRISAVNPAWTTVLGWRDAELIGSNLFDLIHPDDMEHTLEGARSSAQGKSLARFDNRYRHKDGSYRWISWSTRSADGMINAVGRDFTAEKAKADALQAAEAQLRQAQKMEAVGQLTGGVAHDFNNLLTVIKSSIDLLKRPDLPDERRQRYIGAISETVMRAAKLTGQLLAFARRQALKPEVFEVGQSVRMISEMLGTLTGSRIAITTHLSDEPCFVDADPSQFDTAIVNMAVNARDAMNGEGRLTITVGSASDVRAAGTQAALEDRFVAVSISDTGTGIALEQIDLIFEPFFTTKGVGQGTGLGLSQVFGFAKQSGGEIVVHSEVGRGSTFTLYLPQTVGSSKVEEVGTPDSRIDGEGARVLVVEDNAEVGRFTTQSLTELGYAMVWATDAQEALIELAKNPARFDVVFTDVIMPGMNGIELGQEVRRLYPDLPVILTSGYSHVLAQNGTYGFELLHKPYSVEELSRILSKTVTWQRRK